jgi:Fe-S-cluster containining protein
LDKGAAEDHGLVLWQEPDPSATRTAISGEGAFRFHCHPGLACFNRCCREATIILSPYDILRLSRGLGLTTGEFLRRHTRREEEASSRLPLVLVKSTRTGGCPFLREAGCSVYGDRPAACRLFPLTQGSELTPEGVVDHHFLRRLDYCRGFEGEREWTVAAWQADQGFPEFDRPRRPWLSLLLRQAQPDRTPPNDRTLSQFYMVAYDLDGFRAFLFDSALLTAHSIPPADALPLMTDDQALLYFSAAYLEHLLFPEEAPPLQEALKGALTGEQPENL